jgi:RNA polymerase sigma-70 factor (ECF subfamily)
MPDASTTYLQGVIARLGTGDPAARDDLLHHSYDRLHRLAHRMLQDFPRLRRWEDTDDVLHRAHLRLIRALEKANPGTVREFFGLASTQIRRELLDLSRHYFGPEGVGTCEALPPAAGSAAPPWPEGGAGDSTNEPARLASWTEFHEKVGLLPDEEREVIELLWYQGLSKAEAADLLQVAEITVKRRWLAARLRLRELLQGEPP